jgi:hypothetical protein
MLLPDSIKTPFSAVFGILSAGSPSTSKPPFTKSTNDESEKLMSSGGSNPIEKADFRIEGMTCGACVEVSSFQD